MTSGTVIVFQNKVEEQLHKVLLVFPHNANQQTVYQPYVVWRVLHLGSRAAFAYPRDFGVGISWSWTGAKDGQLKGSSRLGPFATVAGSAWQATQHGSETEVTLTEGKSLVSSTLVALGAAEPCTCIIYIPLL